VFVSSGFLSLLALSLRILSSLITPRHHHSHEIKDDIQQAPVSKLKILDDRLRAALSLFKERLVWLQSDPNKVGT
jgi:hypothetical protein